MRQPLLPPGLSIQLWTSETIPSPPAAESHTTGVSIAAGTLADPLAGAVAVPPVHAPVMQSAWFQVAPVDPADVHATPTVNWVMALPMPVPSVQLAPRARRVSTAAVGGAVSVRLSPRVVIVRRTPLTVTRACNSGGMANRISRSEERRVGKGWGSGW